MRWKTLIVATVAVSSSLPAQQQRTPIHGGLPFVSPNGKHIAFTSNRDGKDALYVIQDDGAGLKLLAVAGGVGHWSHNGTQVYFLRSGKDTSSLSSVSIAGGDERVLARVAAHEVLVLPDERRILFGAGDWGSTRLTIANLDGSNAKALTDGSAAIFNPALSPDGQWVAFTRMDKARAISVWVMKLDGTGAKQVSNFPDADGRPQWPSWSPDGKLLAVQSGSYDQKNPKANTAHIWVIDVATATARKLAAHDRPYLDETPSWFPDGKRIAFQSDRTGQMEIFVMNADGTNPRLVTK